MLVKARFPIKIAGKFCLKDDEVPVDDRLAERALRAGIVERVEKTDKRKKKKQESAELSPEETAEMPKTERKVAHGKRGKGKKRSSNRASR